MANIVARINQMIECDQEIILTLRDTAVTRIFGLGGQKTFLSQMNLIESKFITKLFFYHNDFLQGNFTYYSKTTLQSV
jgi:hypothetical protein